MPELPEVETIRRGLMKKILGKKISKIEIETSFEKKIKPNAKTLVDFLLNKEIKNINRIGKLLVFEMTDDDFLLIHLKMTGQLVFQTANKKKAVGGGHSFKNQNELPNKFTRVTIFFVDKSALFFNDIRKFGYFELVDRFNLQKVRDKYGIEPIQTDFTFDFFENALKKRPRMKIKAFLLDQKIILGLGNIYADEVCFSAKVKPNRLVKSLKKVEREALFYNCRSILKLAISKKGTTFSDYRTAYGKNGNFQSYLQVYGRYGESCYFCKKEIKKIKVAGRTSSYCDFCQR
ncbi:MAG: bifunctional DNA-formamidopyrimidine glycosylase/DNA-(apurinic or apyrimidinic site) lyase [Patescibacteria group bacterium]